MGLTARRLLRSFMLALAGLSLLIAPGYAQPPSDVSAQRPSDRALPAPPEGYVMAEDARASWVYPSAASSEVRELREALPELRREISVALGAVDTAPLTLRVATGPDALRALAPTDAPPPAYASGVAYPARGLILLSLTAPESGERPEMRALLLHEVAHIALHRRVEGANVPRWFTEGLAVQLSGGQNIDRIRALWGASSGDSLLPLSQLSRAFPAHAFEVNVAYAQSADFVGYLMRRQDGRESLSAAMNAMARGASFEAAIEEGYRMPLDALDAHWRANLQERYHSWPLALGGGSVWLLAILMLVVGFFRKRRREKTKLAHWAEQEEALDQTLSAIDARLLEAMPPPPTDASVPTVEHDGQRHTLH